MAYLDKSALKRSTLKRKSVNVPALGGEVLLRELTSPEVADFRAYSSSSKDDEARFRLVLGPARMIRFGWINEDGSQVLTEDEESLLYGHSPTEVLEPMVTAISELSGIGKDAIEDAKKNSIETPSADSGSA